MFSILNQAKEKTLDILFPPICLNCQKHLDNKNKYVCTECLGIIKLNQTLFCPVCRARLADNRRICHQDAKYFLAAAGNYDDPVLQNLIHYFKYKSFKNLATILGEILMKYLENLKLSENFIIIPIPLHSKKERQRGFNQAKLIAAVVAKNFNLELFDNLRRIKNNKAQAGLKDSEKRIKNMAGCFALKNPEQIKNKNILLVDDVFTSGATINEAVRVLKADGAKKIIALAIAKA